jgi:hypothetical protein
MKLTEIKSNPNNPRVIKDHKLEKLKKSISEFPKMMELRPMVINEDNIVLGGNMRLKALKDLGYKEVPEEWVKRASDLTDEETRRFIIADNVGFGEHDWDALANEWESAELADWGMDTWQPEESGNWNESENFKDLDELDGYLNKETGVLKLSFLQEQYKEIIQKLDRIQVEEYANDHSEAFLKILEKYEDLRNNKK